MMTAMPQKVMVTKAKAIQASAIAVAPTCPERYHCDVVDIIYAADAAAMCCHKAAARENSDAMPSVNMHSFEISQDGKGFILISCSVRELYSSRQPGKLASRAKVSAESAIAPSLVTNVRRAKIVM